MNFTFYDESSIPVSSEYGELYNKYHVAFLKDKLDISLAAWSDEFTNEFPRRKLIYNPKDGRVFYITDLDRKTTWFTIDLFNRLLPHYWCVANILDRITSSGYENDETVSDSEIERQRARYDYWNDEVEHLDALLNDLKIGIY